MPMLWPKTPPTIPPAVAPPMAPFSVLSRFEVEAHPVASTAAAKLVVINFFMIYGQRLQLPSAVFSAALGLFHGTVGKVARDLGDFRYENSCRQ